MHHYKFVFTVVLVMFGYAVSFGQKDTIVEKTTTFGLELGGQTYSNNEIGAFSGINMGRSNSILSYVVAPLFITNNNIIRLGGMLSVRGNITPKGENHRVFSLTEFGVRYFEILNEAEHYQKTLMFTYGLNLAIYYKKNQALFFHIGAGFDFGGPFVKHQPGFVGIIRTSLLISDIYKIEKGI